MKRIALLGFISFLFLNALSQNEFVTVWNTNAPVTVYGSKANQIKIPAVGNNYNIYWEKVDNPSINGTLIGNGATVVTMPEIGIFLVKITQGNGQFSGLRFGEEWDATSWDAPKLMEIKKWGSFKLATLKFAYSNCRNLKIIATDIPDVSAVTDMSWAFYNCVSLTTIPNMENWNTGMVKRMDLMFSGCTNFNQPIGNWNTSNVTNMTSMFSGCTNFNQPIGSWDVSKVTNINSMFYNCKEFNQPLNNWNTGAIEIMVGAFLATEKFNQPLNKWNVSACKNMNGMFQNAIAFNQPLNNWNVSNVENFQQTFENAKNFNQELGSWKINILANFKMAFNGSGIDSTNYSNTLIGWSNNSSTPNNILLDAVGKKYLPYALSAREKLIAKGWTINDGGLFAVNFNLNQINAIKNSESISVSWTVEGDSPDRIYYLEINENNGAWKRIGTLASKTKSDFSNINNSYSFIFNKNGSVTTASLGFLAALLIFSLLYSRYKRKIVFALIPIFIVSIISCSKDNSTTNNPKEPVTPSSKNKVNIRVVSKDKNGTETISNVVTIEDFDISKF